MAAAQTKKRTLKPKSGEAKYVGHEPTWDTTFDSETDRRLALITALNWYNYNHDTKESRQCLVEWLEQNGRQKDSRAVRSMSNDNFTPSAGWIARMATRGLELSDREKEVIESAVANAHAQKPVKSEEENSEKNKVDIQYRLKEIALNAGGDIEGLFDKMINNGIKFDNTYKPIDILQSHNVVPQKMPLIVDHWYGVLEELQAVQGGKDADLNEGYKVYKKTDIRNMIKFAEKVISDSNSYIQLKKSNRTPRKKKAVSPEKRAAKFKYLKEFEELGIKSLPPSKLVDATEAWIYDTKKRKLIHVLPDPMIKSFTVKGTSIVGFDPKATSQKTLRKPKDQLAEFKKCTVPKSRTWFNDIKATEVKFSGRSNENLIILSAR